MLDLQRSIGNSATRRLFGSLGSRTANAVQTNQNGLLPAAVTALQTAFDQSGKDEFDPGQEMYKALPVRWQTRLLDVKGRNTKRPTGATQTLQRLVQAVALSTLAGKVETEHLAADPAEIDQAGKIVDRSKVRDAALLDLGPASPEAKTFADHYGFRLEVPQGTAEPPPGPRLDVRSTFIGSRALGIGLRAHLFLVYTTEAGEQRVLRGGPGEPVGGLSYGYARADVGTYHPDHVDWDPSAPSVTVAKGNAAKSKLSTLVDATRAVNAKKVPYDPIRFQTGGATGIFGGDNCNTIAWTLLKKSDLPTRKPSGFHPGWGHELGSTGKGTTTGPAPKQPPKALRQMEARRDIQLYRDALLSEKAEVLKAGQRYFLTDDDTTDEPGVLIGDQLRYLDRRHHEESRHVGKLVHFDGHRPGAFFRAADQNGRPTGEAESLHGMIQAEVLDVRYLRKEPLHPDDWIEARLHLNGKDYPIFLNLAGIVDQQPASKPPQPQGKPLEAPQPPESHSQPLGQGPKNGGAQPQGKPPVPPRQVKPEEKPPPPKPPQGNPQPLVQGPKNGGAKPPRPLPQPPGKLQGGPPKPLQGNPQPLVQGPKNGGAKPQAQRPVKPALAPPGRDFEVVEHTWTKPLKGEQGGIGMIGPGATVTVVDPAFDPADTSWRGKDVRIVVNGVERLIPAQALMPKVTKVNA